MSAFFSLSRVHICALAGSASLVFQHLLTGGYEPGICVIVFIDWFIVNILNRIVDEKEDVANGIPHSRMSAAKRTLVYAICGILLAVTFAGHFFWYQWYPQLVIPRLTGLVLSLMYNYRLLYIPGSGMARLKETYFLKNVASCVGFLLTLFWYPLACGGWGSLTQFTHSVPPHNSLHISDHVDTPYVCVLVLYFALFEIGFEVIYDIRDVVGDRLHGVRSYPVVHGSDFSLTLVGVLDTLAIEVLLFGWWLGYIRFREAMFAVGVLIQYVMLQVFLYANDHMREGSRVTAKGARQAPRLVTPAQTTALTWAFVAAMVVYVIHEQAGFSQEWPFGTLSTARVIDLGLVVVGIFTWLWNREEYGDVKFLLWYVGIGLGGALAENTCIHVYEFYHYNQSEWLVYVGVMPLEVIFGVRGALRKMGLQGVVLALVGFGEVTAQAFFMEVSCVNAGLWFWSKDNVFGVPFIGALGWSLFGIVCLLAMEYLNGSLGQTVFGAIFVTPLVGTAFVHVGLVVMWQFLGFEWISDIMVAPAVACQAMASVMGLVLFVTVVAWLCGARLPLTPVVEFPRLLAGQLVGFILMSHAPAWHLIVFVSLPAITYFSTMLLASLSALFNAPRMENVTSSRKKAQ